MPLRLGRALSDATCLALIVTIRSGGKFMSHDGHIAVLRDLPVAQLHNRDALEHRACTVGLQERRAIAEDVARMAYCRRSPGRALPRDNPCHSIAHVMGQLWNLRAPGERAVEHIVMDAAFRELSANATPLRCSTAAQKGCGMPDGGHSRSRWLLAAETERFLGGPAPKP